MSSLFLIEDSIVRTTTITKTMALQTIISSAMEHPYLFSFVCFTLLYFAYYLTVVGKKPLVACGDDKLRRLINHFCPIVEEKFWPTWWCFEGRIHTIVRSLFQPAPQVHFSSEIIPTPDGGELELDWFTNDENSQYPSATRPTVVFLPGLTGSSKENYIINFVLDCTDLGYRSIVFHHRGVGNSRLKTPRLYCATAWQDTDVVVRHLKTKIPDAPLLAVGISMGGMILLRYLAEKGPSAGFDAAMVISVVWNVSEGVQLMEQWVNRYLLNKPLAYALCNMFRKNHEMFKHLVDTEHVLKSKTIREFDTRCTAKLFGYKSVEEYYADASADDRLVNICKPVLCLSAADDPFAPGHVIPMKRVEEIKNIAIVQTSYGGHIGFMEGAFLQCRSYMNRWFKQYASAFFQHGKKDL